MRILLKVVFLTSGLVLGAAGVAGAVTYPPGACALATSSTTVAAGGTVGFSTTGSCGGTEGFVPGTTVTVVLASGAVTLGTTTADVTGGISASFAIPANTAPGQHTITATGAAASGGTLSVSTSILVAGASTRSPLAFTGSSSNAPLFVVGAGALALGGGLVFVSHRRRARVSV